MNSNGRDFTQSSVELFDEFLLPQIINTNSFLCWDEKYRTSRMEHCWNWESVQLEWNSLGMLLGELVYKNSSWFTWLTSQENPVRCSKINPYISPPSTLSKKWDILRCSDDDMSNLKHTFLYYMDPSMQPGGVSMCGSVGHIHMSVGLISYYHQISVHTDLTALYLISFLVFSSLSKLKFYTGNTATLFEIPIVRKEDVDKCA